MENYALPSEIVSAIITVGGSVLTFFLASWFSAHSRKTDEKFYYIRELLNHRLAYYEDLLSWLPSVRLLDAMESEELSSGSLEEVFVKDFAELTQFIVRARLYASDEVIRELIVFQEEYNVALSKALSDKKDNKPHVDGKSCGDVNIDSLVNIRKSRADRIITAVSAEMTANSPYTVFGKLKKKRNQKGRRTAT
jgi:hypothetical protein